MGGGGRISTATVARVSQPVHAADDDTNDAVLRDGDETGSHRYRNSRQANGKNLEYFLLLLFPLFCFLLRSCRVRGSSFIIIIISH